LADGARFTKRRSDMKKCPKCKTVDGSNRGKPATYRFCPMCGAKLEDAKGRRIYMTRVEWEEFNRIEHAVPWNEDIKVKGLEDESF
jgi:Zn finger protein HypA/HybF involved in hydrogenase expression